MARSKATAIRNSSCSWKSFATICSPIGKPEELKPADTDVINERELKMAQTLVESMSVPWEPDKYKDEYRDALMDIIEQKAQRREVEEKPAAKPRTTNVVDLVKVLQESLNRAQAVKPKRSAARNGNRSTSALVKQKRRAAA